MTEHHDRVKRWREADPASTDPNERADARDWVTIGLIIQDEIASRYHPEFGTEWQEGGSLNEFVRIGEECVWQQAHDDYCEPNCQKFGHDNPYRKES